MHTPSFHVSAEYSESRSMQEHSRQYSNDVVLMCLGSCDITATSERHCYAPRRISGEHIVAASSVRPCVRASVRPYVRVSVRPCVRPALVHANSRKLLVGFQ